MNSAIRKRIADLTAAANQLDRLLARPDADQARLFLCRAGVAIDEAAAKLQRLAGDLTQILTPPAEDSTG